MAKKILRDVARGKEFEELTGVLGSKEYKPKSGQRPRGAPVFGTIRELLCFAAFLGFSLERREALTGPVDYVPEEVFAKNEDALDCVRMIALAEAKDPSIFEEANVDKMVTIFEEYANGGLKVIQSFMAELPTDLLGADAIIEGLTNKSLLDRVSSKSGAPGLGGVEF